ncbi:MAG TPA: WecB/TagA/CpsF family glycosyltransferase [Hymenobacter sp.]|nr:WecB/TagA/CpsF family glycosyltransferase [Hymenobacter sp.]
MWEATLRPLTDEEDKHTVQAINEANPDVVWIGLSTPKQERWMAEHIGRLTAPVLVGVGAAFDFHSGLKRQAPHWMQRSGLEWLFRLANEPRRLWRRYLVNNPLFTLLVLQQALNSKRYSLDEQPPALTHVHDNGHHCRHNPTRSLQFWRSKREG